MKAVVYSVYGPPSVLQPADIAKPVLPIGDMTASDLFRKANLKQGQQVLTYGGPY